MFLFITGTASVARGFSAYFDSLIDKKIAKFFNATMPIHVDELSDYPDFFAFGITLVLTGMTCCFFDLFQLFRNSVHYYLDDL